jgi:molybdopterin molybdotransferase
MSSAHGDPAGKRSFGSPEEALDALCQRLKPVTAETVSLERAAGRVLAAPVHADRDSPPCDVSSMDGYAVRLADLHQPALEVAGEAAVGQPPPPLPLGKAVRIFTGAPVPPDTEAVIQREHVGEERQQIVLRALPTPAVRGLNIRRQGENVCAGQPVLAEGTLITPAAVASLASFGAARLSVQRRLRVGIINTGSELVAPEAHPAPWHIRDTNGPALAALLAKRAWLDVLPPLRVRDDYAAIRSLLADTVAQCDAVLLTGGVSAGQYDFVPDVVAALGGEIIFHRLPTRPGAPVLGALGPQAQAILGLPGNPVSAMIAARRLVWAVLRQSAGFAAPRMPVPAVRLTNADDQSLRLWWFRLVRLTGPGAAELIPTQGSGDVVSLGRSDGFVELPPAMSGAGPWPFYAWEQ